MESVGTRLKNLRLEKGLTLEDAHKKTKIHLNILKAIEDDSLVGINPIYIKGFLKIYCKFLGADPKDYVPDYKEPQGVVKISKGPGEGGFAAGSFLSKGGLFRLGSSLKKIRIKIKTLLVIAGVLVLIIILFNLGKLVSSKRRSLPAQTKIPIVLPQKTEKKKVLPLPQKRQSVTVAAQKRNASSVIRLGLHAKDDSWVDLRVDGKVVFRNILKRGKFESWSANDKIELSLGNAGVVELELDGRAIPPLGRRGQAIKGIRITRNEGLTVPR